MAGAMMKERWWKESKRAEARFNVRFTPLFHARQIKAVVYRLLNLLRIHDFESLAFLFEIVGHVKIAGDAEHIGVDHFRSRLKLPVGYHHRPP